MPVCTALNDDQFKLLDAYWRAANYLTIGQIYLMANPLLREPLRPEHIKPRLLGHWGTSPGQNFIYAHLNRLIKLRDASVIFVSGPGHGGPSLTANTYLEGSYTEIYPSITRDAEGMRKFFRQFSSPGGISSHAGPHVPGSINEGGELGYSLLHAFGAAFDNPDLIVACVIGDGEAETAPLEGAWKSIDFLNPVRDGAVLPILHLNGYKISGPTTLARHSNEQIRKLLEGHGYQVYIVDGDDPFTMHREFAATLDQCYAAICAIQHDARTNGFSHRPIWPAIVLRSPKGWTGPKIVDGKQIEGTFRAHQVPLDKVKENPEHLKMFEAWMRSYRPGELFDVNGRLVPELQAMGPVGIRRMGANPHANGGLLTISLDIPSFTDYAIPIEMPGNTKVESTRPFGAMLRDIFKRNEKQQNFRLFCPDETNSNRLGDVFEVENRCLVSHIENFDDHVSPTGRVMEVLSEHCHQGWLEGYTLTGRHGLFASYEAFAMIVDSMVAQHAKWLKTCRTELPWRRPVPSLNYLLTSTCWRNDHNGFSHQGPGFIDALLTKQGIVSRIYLPPDANCLLSVADHCLRSRGYINLIVIDKQMHPVWLDIDSAREHCARGASNWRWAGNENGIQNGQDPDLVMACAGDVPTEETIAAAWLLRKYLPEMKVRVVNIVDLMTLFTPENHPHGMDEDAFADLFTTDKHVIFSFHGYPGAIHEIIHGRPNPDRFHVRGYVEEGTTTTPFDMLVLNRASRYHLCIDALKRAPHFEARARELIEKTEEALAAHRKYIAEHLEDMPVIRNWRWTPS
ncbi:MAG: phosphoketolase family protein [Candidatus Binatus sp.]|uniref:phosphoketolase family protein n=1 Tax=Candidatus Binatus sp. TaxID=2811406 RepID=UPI0027271E40|nr:phosphoketolase family protein [Candidatus Binatus sp.]MDO8430891.1 phosphoketolase family protein [Candidatus Binatus sp.]